jgi:hypothetical protein
MEVMSLWLLFLWTIAVIYNKGKIGRDASRRLTQFHCKPSTTRNLLRRVRVIPSAAGATTGILLTRAVSRTQFTLFRRKYLMRGGLPSHICTNAHSSRD